MNTEIPMCVQVLLSLKTVRCCNIRKQFTIVLGPENTMMYVCIRNIQMCIRCIEMRVFTILEIHK